MIINNSDYYYNQINIPNENTNGVFFIRLIQQKTNTYPQNHQTSKPRTQHREKPQLTQSTQNIIKDLISFNEKRPHVRGHEVWEPW